jgi:hypothetical protein
MSSMPSAIAARSSFRSDNARSASVPEERELWEELIGIARGSVELLKD